MRMAINTALLALACSAAALGGPLTERASAGHNTPCTNADITRAVAAVTGGNVALGHLCNPGLYNNGQWTDYNSLVPHVRTRLNACGDSAANRNLTQAVIEYTGITPDYSVCATQIYQNFVNQTQQNPQPIDWSSYKGYTYPSENAHAAISGTMSLCSLSKITQAVIRETGALPNQARATGTPDAGGTVVHSDMGQCNPALYNNGEVYDWGQLRTAVQNRKSSTTTCADAFINRAVSELTGGWKPLPHECEAARYGFWGSDYGVAKSRIYGAWRCRDPWIGQAYALAIGRRVRGHGASGECNPYLYGSGRGGGGWSTYADLEQRVRQVTGMLVAQKIELRSNGGAYITVNGVRVTVPPQEVLIGNSLAGKLALGNGNLISDNGLGVVAAGGGNLFSLIGGSVIAAGGGNVIAAGGGNVIAAGGGNVIAAGGGNVVAAGGGN